MSKPDEVIPMAMPDRFSNLNRLNIDPNPILGNQSDACRRHLAEYLTSNTCTYVVPFSHRNARETGNVFFIKLQLHTYNLLVAYDEHTLSLDLERGCNVGELQLSIDEVTLFLGDVLPGSASATMFSRSDTGAKKRKYVVKKVYSAEGYYCDVQQ